MKKAIAILMVAIMTLALSVGTCAATVDNGGGAGDTKVLQLAPPNPDFEAYWKKPPETSYGYIPPPVDLSHLDRIPVEWLPRLYAFPSSFDWRDYGSVSSVKNQNPCGTCWIFGTTSVLESAVLIAESEVYDFSEQSVALCVDPSWVYLYDGSTDPCHSGGWSWLASEVFIKKGSVLETCNPYDTSALNCDGSCVCDNCPPVEEVDGYRLATNNGSKIDEIKNAVYYQGPVTMAFYYTSSGEYSVEPWGTIYDYYPCSGSTNHIVSIIGWDDAVPHPNHSHEGTGAWIVKNSWGTGWGNNGFFYLAYNSSCVTEIAYLEYKDDNAAEELLYWDEAGLVYVVGYGDNNAWMASVFTATQSGNLTHVDFWTTSNNAQYELHVWDDYFGSELANQTGNCQEFGYYSIPLNKSISIDAGQQFTVGVKMTTPGYNYPIPVEGEISGQVDPLIQSGVSFIRHTASSSWTDLADHDCNACLRARLTAIADLLITDTWLCWPDNCTICYNVTNTGDGTAPACHNTTLYVDGVEVAHDHVPVDLAPGESYTGCFNGYVWAYTPPSDNITVCADNNETVDESDEDNNCLTNIWMCGDVTGDGRVRTSDGIRIFHHITYGVPIDNMWAADVTGDGRVRTSDGIRIFHHITYGVTLNCKCSG